VKAPPRLRDLPGFDDAMAKALEFNEHRLAQGYMGYPLELVGEISVPSLKRVSSGGTLDQLALIIWGELHREQSRLRIVARPLPVAANDTGAR
jgi:hypothetical protein